MLQPLTTVVLMPLVAAAPVEGVESVTMDSLLILAIVLLAGIAGGAVARSVSVPAITGNILAGTLLGVTLLRGVDVAESLGPLSAFAIGLIAVTAGGHLSYRRIHNALRRIILISVFQVAGAVLLSTFAMVALGQSWLMAWTLGVIAASGAPATTVALIRETRAKGPTVKTLLASVSIDSSLSILLFAFVHGLMITYFASSDPDQVGLWTGAQQTIRMLTGSVGLGVGLGLVSTFVTSRGHFHGFSFMLLAVMLATGVSNYLNFDPLLTCLFFGMFLSNSSDANERQLDALTPVEPMLYTAFFTLAGIALHLDMLLSGGLLFVAYVVSRAVGKGFGAWLGSVLSGSSERIRKSVPYGFVPQAGVALGLVVILQTDSRIPEEFSSLAVTLVLASITFNEIVGPFLTRYSLSRSQETGLDRPRLVEFLQEEFVLVGLEAEDKWDALEQLVDFYARTHRVTSRKRQVILETVRAREEEHTTAIGLEAALPHGWLESGTAIQGVLGIAHDGVDWDSPDGQKAKIIVLIVTPRDHESRHLEVLASLSGMITNERLRERLIAATDANDAWEVLESKESRDFNYFLEGEDWDAGESNGRASQSAAAGS